MLKYDKSQKDYCKSFTVKKKKKIYHLNLLKDLISQMVYIGHDQSLSPGREILAKFFSQPRPRIVFKFFPQYLPISTLPTFLVSTFLISSLPPPPPTFSRQLARRFIFVSRIVKKGEKAHEKVFGSRPANIVHSNLFPLYFPPLLSLEISSC